MTKQIHKFSGGYPTEWKNIWICYESGQMSRAELNDWMHADHERQAFVADMKSDRLAKQCSSDWKARNREKLHGEYRD